MHAGEALWHLYAEVTMMERRYSDIPSTLEVLAKQREQLDIISKFISVEPPASDKVQELIEAIAPTLRAPAVEPPKPPQEESTTTRDDFSAPDRIAAAQTILDDMVNSGSFDWADMVSSLQSAVNGDKPFMTDRQFRAVVNIARKGDEGEYWERLSDEYPEAVSIAEAAADKAR